MHIKTKVITGVLWVLASALVAVGVLIFTVNQSFDGVLDVSQQAQMLAFIMVAMLLVVLVSGNIIARQISEPVTALAKFVSSMSRGRSPESLPYLDNKDAIGDLARAVEALSLRFQNELSASVEAGQSAKREMMASNFRLQELGRDLKQSKAEIEESSKHLEDLEIVDHATGLHNRLYFDRVCEYETKRSQRNGRALSIAAFELACWRDIKAGLGRPAADAVLKQMADTISATVRSTDFVARYSDNAIGLLLPETGAKNAARVIDNIYSLLESSEWPVAPKLYKIVIGAGVVATDALMPSEESATERLEAAIAKSISGGGGRVEVA